MLFHYGRDIGSRLARKHIGWYARGLPGAAEFRAAVNRTDEPERVRGSIDAFYEPLLARRAT
jgi:tRNA-dihydrouridine synthase B